MKRVRPELSFESVDGTLQYKLVRGSQQKQMAVLAKGGFSWLSAPENRELIVDNPELNFDNKGFLTGTGVDYVNQGRILVYFSPQNRIIQAGTVAHETRLDAGEIAELVADAAKPGSGVLAVDLGALVKNKRFYANTKSGSMFISTSDYTRQMNDDPNVAALVSACYSPRGELLNRIMNGIRKNCRQRDTLVYVLMPDYVTRRVAEGNGIGRLSAIDGFYSHTDAGSINMMDSSPVFNYAIGVRPAHA